jgi:hypothetical protein
MSPRSRSKARRNKRRLAFRNACHLHVAEKARPGDDVAARLSVLCNCTRYPLPDRCMCGEDWIPPLTTTYPQAMSMSSFNFYDGSPLSTIVSLHDLRALEDFCLARKYRDVIAQAKAEGIDLDVLEDMLQEIS